MLEIFGRYKDKAKLKSHIDTLCVPYKQIKHKTNLIEDKKCAHGFDFLAFLCEEVMGDLKHIYKSCKSLRKMMLPYRPQWNYEQISWHIRHTYWKCTIDLGQLWIRYWLVAWLHQTITWTSDKLSLVMYCGINVMTIWQRLHQLLYCMISFKILLLKLPPHLLGTIKLTLCLFIADPLTLTVSHESSAAVHSRVAGRGMFWWVKI